MAKKKSAKRKKGKKDFQIGFVGVGRMGANMALNLNDKGFKVSAVFDANRRTARSLAKGLGCAAPKTLAEVTALSDVVITVVTDDAAMRSIFSTSGDSLLTNAKGTTFINCATISPRGPRPSRRAHSSSRCFLSRRLHGLKHHPSAPRHAVPDVRRQAQRL